MRSIEDSRGWGAQSPARLPYRSEGRQNPGEKAAVGERLPHLGFGELLPQVFEDCLGFVKNGLGLRSRGEKKKRACGAGKRSRAWIGAPECLPTGGGRGE